MIYFRLPIANCQIEMRPGLEANRQSAIKNRQLFNSPISNNHLLCTLVVTRLISARRLAPWGHRISSAGSLSFAASMRVVHRIHRHAAHMWANAAPTGAAGFT
jgi:hypothetical protein